MNTEKKVPNGSNASKRKKNAIIQIGTISFLNQTLEKK